MAWLRELEDSETTLSVVLEDDERAGYAYLLHRGEVVQDVFLFKQAAHGPRTPDGEAPWVFARDTVKVEWRWAGKERMARVFVEGNLATVFQRRARRRPGSLTGGSAP